MKLANPIGRCKEREKRRALTGGLRPGAAWGVYLPLRAGSVINSARVTRFTTLRCHCMSYHMT